MKDSNDGKESTLALHFMKDEMISDYSHSYTQINPYIADPKDEEESALTELNEPDNLLLKSAEEQLVENWVAFLDVAEALSEIKSHKLYRATHSSFSDYCKDRLHLIQINRRFKTGSTFYVNVDYLEALGMKRGDIMNLDEHVQNHVDHKIGLTKNTDSDHYLLKDVI